MTLIRKPAELEIPQKIKALVYGQAGMGKTTLYPYCLNQNGNSVFDFEYNIAVINRTKYGVNYNTHTEYFAFNPETDTQRLTKHVEGFIEFIELNKDLITDKKIFNQL